MRFIAPLGLIAVCLVLTAAAKKCEKTSDCNGGVGFLCVKGKCGRECLPDPKRNSCGKNSGKKCGYLYKRGTDSDPFGNFCIKKELCCRKNGVPIDSDDEHWVVGGCYNNKKCPKSPSPKFAKPIGEEKP